MRRSLYVAVYLILTFCCSCLAGSAWRIEAIELHPGGERGQHVVTAIVSSEVTGDRVKLSASIPLVRIDEQFVTGDKLVLIGDADRPQAVAIFDLRTRNLTDWFVCYAPQRVSEHWLAFVEFYFPHVSGGEPTDVVLIYDLSKSPSENRLEREPGMKFPPGVLDEAAQHVGTPVYPAWNVEQKSYRNVVADQTETRGAAMGMGGFALVGTSKLVFVASEGTFPDKYNYLIAVDLSAGADHPMPRKIDIPKGRVRKPDRFPNFTTVIRVEAVSPTAVRIYVPESDYGRGSIVVDIE